MKTPFSRTRLRLAACLASGVAVAPWAAAVSRPASPPDVTQQSTDPGLDTASTSLTVYDIAGRVASVTDNSGTTTAYTYDALGRRIQTIENHVDGDPDTGASDEDRVTRTTYDAVGRTVALTADLPGADDQTTYYVYSGETNGTSNASASYSPVPSNNLLVATVYPDAVEDAGWTTRAAIITAVNGPAGDYQEQTYTATGQAATRTDQRGVTLTYAYDDAGRRTSQAVTAGAVPGDLRIETAYDDRGQVEAVTTYDAGAGGSITSEVEYAYDGFGRPLKEYQDHDSAVVTTGGSATPHVAFAYDTDASDGFRLESVTYPNGVTTVAYAYDGHNGIDDALSRASRILADSTSGDTLAEYQYLGSGRLARKLLGPDTQDRLVLDFSEDHPDIAGTQAYGGYDRFGRTARMHWYTEDGANPDVTRFDLRHGYDRASNRLFTDRRVYTGQSEAFTHDGLHRMDSVNRGMLSDTTPVETHYAATAPTAGYLNRHEQDFTYDTLGNQDNIETRESATHTANEHNDANEITSRDARGAVRVLTSEGLANDDHLESPGGAGDTYSVSGGWLTIDGVSADTFDSQTEEEARTIVLFGPETGPYSALMQLKFPSGATTGDEAGFVFGYQGPNDYWLQVQNVNDKAYTYHVVNGVRTQMDVKNSNITPGTAFLLRAIHDAEYAYGYPFGKVDLTDGFPSGRIGFYSNRTDVEFNYQSLNVYDFPTRLADRYMGTGKFTLSGDQLRGAADPVYATQIGHVIDGVQMSPGDGWEVTFSIDRSGSGQTGVYFRFGVSDESIGTIRFDHFNSKSLPSISQDGTVTTSTDSSHYPTLTSTDTLWVRVRFDGTDSIKIYAADELTGSGGTSLEERTSADEWCVHANGVIDDTGGLFALRQHYWGYALIDNLTIESDRTGGVGGIPDGTLDTTDLIDDFAETSGVATIEPTHDAAGNLTFDGLHSYTYDAWNRLITVAGAYRDPTAGTVQTGHTTATYRYDGLNRRIVRTLATINGDTTCHDYYRGWSLIETQSGSGGFVRQCVWGLGYIDELVANVVLESNILPFGTEVNETFGHYSRVTYAAHDRLFNILGLFDRDDTTNDWSIAERYEYTPYGERQVYASAGPDDPDAQASRLRGQRTYSYDILGGPTVWATEPLNPFGFQGLRHDETHGGDLVDQRRRPTNPRTGQFLTRDPAGYPDGLNALASYFVLLSANDPLGTRIIRLETPHSQGTYYHYYDVGLTGWFKQEHVGTVFVPHSQGGVDYFDVEAYRFEAITRRDQLGIAQAGAVGADGIAVAGGILLIASIFAPGPEDALLAAALSRHGFRFAIREGKRVLLRGNRLANPEEVMDARRALRREANDLLSTRRSMLMSPDEFCRLPNSGTVDPRKIRFTQDTVTMRTSRGESVDDLAEALRASGSSQAPPIQIFEYNGRIYSMDNRRLFTHLAAGVDVPYEKVTVEELGARFRSHYTTRNGGIDVRVVESAPTRRRGSGNRRR